MIKLLFFVSLLSAFATETYYVQSVKTDLKLMPNASSGILKTLPRGAQLTVIAKEGLWYKVKSEEQTGWVCRLFLAPHRPVGKAELENIPEELEKASRRRPSSYVVTAATRGGFESNRVRGSRELYKSDFSQLKKIEEYNIPENKLFEFWSTANLTVK